MTTKELTLLDAAKRNLDDARDRLHPIAEELHALGGAATLAAQLLRPLADQAGSVACVISFALSAPSRNARS